MQKYQYFEDHNIFLEHGIKFTSECHRKPTETKMFIVTHYLTRKISIVIALETMGFSVTQMMLIQTNFFNLTLNLLIDFQSLK